MLIEECIQSILRFNKTNDFEIIVVDNSPIESQKITENICNKLNDQIIYLPNPNLGYGQGNNVGIKRAKGEIVCVINPDVRFVEPFEETVLSFFANDEKNVLLGLKQIGGSNLSYYLKPEYYLPFFNVFIVKLFNKLEIYNSKFFFLSGACFFVKKTKFEEIGLFDETFFMFNEEADINNRFLKINCKIKYLNNIKYDHLVGDRKSVSVLLFEHEIKSLHNYLKKYNLNINFIFLMKKFEYYLTSKIRYKVFNEFIKSQKIY
jgi:GT2 family glycosyltransferase